MMSFSDFIHNYKLGKESASSLKIYQVLSTLGLSDVVFYLKDGPFKSDIGIVNLHPSKGTYWVIYINEK